MSLELFKKGSRRILEDSKNPGESWKLCKQEMIIQGVPKKRGISECYSVCFTAHLILSLENLFIIYLKVEIHMFLSNTKKISGEHPQTSGNGEGKNQLLGILAKFFKSPDCIFTSELPTRVY